jgi:cell division protease FtsH
MSSGESSSATAKSGPFGGKCLRLERAVELDSNSCPGQAKEIRYALLMGRAVSARQRVLVTLLIVIAATVLAYRFFSSPGSRPLDQSSFYGALAEGRVEEVTITADDVGYEIRGQFHSDESTPGGRAGGKFTTYVVEDDSLRKMLRESGVRVTTRKPRGGFLRSALGLWIPLLLILGIFVFFMRRMLKGGNQTLSLMKSRAKLSGKTDRTTFDDVAGVEEAKHDLQEIVEFLKDPRKFQKLGGKIPLGVLLVGPTGTGKTLLARAVAGEAQVPFFSVSGSDFVEMFVGIGASRVRDLFQQGRKNAPCIVFVDEIDAVGRRRGAGLGGGHDEREQTLNQLLVEMDGFETNEGVIVLAATNRPDVLDPALLRPGRFDRQIVVDRPDVRGREEIIKIHVRKVPLAPDVDLSLVARGTPGFSGADLANLVNEAALHGARYNREAVTPEDVEVARDKVLMGSERRSLVVSDEEKCATAYHEAGHALMAHLLPAADPLHKATIVPRGRALGTTQQLPVDDRHTESKSYLLATICVLMGGRVAEQLGLNRLSSGAGEDFERTTELARRMVTEWGMSERLGPLTYGKRREQIFLGREIAQRRDHSEATAAEIDREVKKIVMGCYEKARRILEERAEALKRVAEALLVHEVLDAEQIAALVRNEPLPRRSGRTTESRKQLEAECQDEEARHVGKRAIGDGLPRLPEPDPRPA